MADGDALDLFVLVEAIWRRKGIVIAVALVFALAGLTYALLKTPIYRAEVLLAPRQPEGAMRLPFDVGGLAGLAGLNLGNSGDARELLAAFRSRTFAESFIQDEGLLPVLFSDSWDEEKDAWIGDAESHPDIRDAVKFFIEKVRFIEEDPRTGLVTLAVEWIDPEVAASWAHRLAVRINEQIRSRDLDNAERRLKYLNAQLDLAGPVELRQVISRLIQEQVEIIALAAVDPEYAFKIVDPPHVPKEKVRPKRALILILSTFLGGIFGSLVAVFVHLSAYRFQSVRG